MQYYSKVMKTYKYIQNNCFFRSRLTGDHHNDLKNNKENHWLYISQCKNKKFFRLYP